ncbi:hypothetical protein BJV74DRAFT_458845 [Russula compacta]|nr:hypothetical protein BJV74DRAFT_458845 [Russula compacta]
MADSNSSSIPPDIAKVTAPLLFGVIFNWALYGVLCVQTYVYSYNFPHDGRWMKALAYFVFLLETVQTALTGADAYYWFMAGFGNMERLRNSNFGGIDNPLMDAIISLVVQVFFCYRIWTLSDRTLWLPLLIVVLAVAQAIGATWAGIKSATMGAYAITKVAQYLWLIACTLVDIVIAVVMMWLLRQRENNEDQHSKHIVQRIMRLTIETNTVTASVALITFVLYVAYPNEIYYTCLTVIIGKLYSNTLFITLIIGSTSATTLPKVAQAGVVSFTQPVYLRQGHSTLPKLSPHSHSRLLALPSRSTHFSHRQQWTLRRETAVSVLSVLSTESPPPYHPTHANIPFKILFFPSFFLGFFFPST